VTGGWNSDVASRFGQVVYDAVPQGARALWVADVLEVAVNASRIEAPQIRRVIEVGRDPARWTEGHEAFDQVRTLALANRKSTAPDALLGVAFDLAETAAKVIFNASGAPAPFDKNAGWLIAPRLRALVEMIADDVVAKKAFEVLTHHGVGDAG